MEHTLGTHDPVAPSMQPYYRKEAEAGPTAHREQKVRLGFSPKRA